MRIAGTRAVFLFVVAFTCTAALGSPFDFLNRKIDFEMTGTVRDADTKEPLEGAYVIATYRIIRSGLAAIATPCVKTKGMYTGKDGMYHFPVEKLDGRNPQFTNAIKPGYFWLTSDLPDSANWQKQNAAAYSGRDIYLKKQDPSKPDWHFSDGGEICDEAPNREAAAAGIEFLRLKLAELTKYGASNQGRNATETLIRLMEESGAKTPAK